MTSTLRFKAHRGYQRRPKPTRRALARQQEMVEGMVAHDWFVFLVRSQASFGLVKEFRRLGGDAVLPVEYRWDRKRLGKLQDREMKPYPAFPGYLFGRIAMRQMGAIFALSSVHGVIGRDGVPESVPGAVIAQMEGLRLYEPDQGKFTRKRQTFLEGDKAEILEGPFMGYVIEIESLRESGVDAVLDMFGKQHKISVGLEALQKID